MVGKGGLDSARHRPFLFFDSIHLWLILLYLDSKLKVGFSWRIITRYLRGKG